MKCPICAKTTVEEYKPFCCRRCADVDLGRWMNESYAIPAVEEDRPDEEDLTDIGQTETRH